MRKIIYLFAAIGLIFTSACTPMDDINAEIDAQKNPIVGNATFTLTDADYSDLGLTYGSFSNLDDAKTMLPAYLKAKYPVWGKGSSALVGYKLYVGSAPGVSAYTGAAVYTLTKADYALSGSDVLGFYPDKTPTDYLADILTTNITAPSEGQVSLVKYIQYTEVPTVISSKIYFQDNFDYGTTAGDLTTITSDWTNHSGTTPIGYATSSLSMTDYPSTAVGGSVTIAGAGSEDANSVFTTISSGKVYASALVNLSAVGSGTYFLHFMDDAFGYSARISAKTDGAGKILFGIGAGSAITYGTNSFDLNTTYLVVASYDIDTWVSNLYVLASPVATEPGTPEVTASGGTALTVQKIAVRQGSGGPTGTIDGIRVASSWTSIMSNNVIEDIVTGDKVYHEGYYTYTSGKWAIPKGIYVLSTEDYDAMGTASGQPGKYNNFDSSMGIDGYISTFLKLKYPFAQEGENLIVIYKYYSSSARATQTRGNLYTVTDGAWMGYLSTINTTLQFGNDGTKWVPDNTIKYEFVKADYDYIVATFTGVAGYETAVANLGSYGNISTFNWTAAQIDAAINAVLKHNFPGMAEGQKFAVTIFVYDGSSHNKTMNYILSGGSYVLQ